MNVPSRKKKSTFRSENHEPEKENKKGKFCVITPSEINIFCRWRRLNMSKKVCDIT
jgi:hypothetical protein